MTTSGADRSREAVGAVSSQGNSMASLDVPDTAIITRGAVRQNPVDPDVQAEALHCGGRNWFGEPNYRVIWGYQRGVWINGEFVFKYVRAKERFILEKWVSPEKLAAHMAPELYEAVGEPFPNRGEYECLFVFEDPITNGYVRPTVELVRQAIERNQRSAARTQREINAGIEQEMETKRRDTERTKDDILDDALCAFPEKSWVSVSGPQTPTSRRSFEKSDIGG